MNEATKMQLEKPQPMTMPEFSQLGVGHLAYVRAIQFNGMPAFAIYSAAGQQLAVVPTRDAAIGLVRQHDMEPASLH
jgi:hypothetical protein